jgi:hypothetical protein
MVSVSQSVSQLPRSYSYRIHKVVKPRRARRLRRRRAQARNSTRAPRGAGGPPGPARLGPGGSRGLAAARYLSLRLVNRVRVLGGGHFASGISCN